MFITFCPKWHSLVGFRESNHFVNSENFKKRGRKPDPVFLAGKYHTCVECSKEIFPKILCNTNSILQLPSLLKRWKNCGHYFWPILRPRNYQSHLTFWKETPFGSEYQFSNKLNRKIQDHATKASWKSFLEHSKKSTTRQAKYSSQRNLKKR